MTYPNQIPIIPNTPAAVKGAGIGSLRNENRDPTPIPVTNDSNSIILF